VSIPPFPYPVPSSVPADPVLREFYPEFVERWLADLTSQWPEIVERNDAEEMYRFGHTIKGSFLQFGLKELAGIGKDIMAASAENDWTTATYFVNGLTEILQVLHQRNNSSEPGAHE
jgi:hypothetical protein